MASSERFGYEWERYSFLTPEYEAQFRAWIHPLKREDFIDRSVLDAGCGMGRNSYWPLMWGADRLIAFDLDDRSVKSAQNTLEQFSNAQVIKRSIYEARFIEQFDITMCIGVLHHLDDPGTAIVGLFESLKVGGKMIVWVYSYEGNEWIVRYIDPLRKALTSRLPVGLVHFLGYFFSLPLWLYLKLLPQRDKYLSMLSKFDFWHIHSIVFDQLIPRVANYWKREEIVRLFDNAGISNIGIHKPGHGTGWTIICEKK